MKILGLILLMLLTGCTQAQPELRETKEVQTSIPYSDEELIKNANDKIWKRKFLLISSIILVYCRICRNVFPFNSSKQKNIFIYGYGL